MLVDGNSSHEDEIDEDVRGQHLCLVVSSPRVSRFKGREKWLTLRRPCWWTATRHTKTKLMRMVLKKAVTRTQSPLRCSRTLQSWLLFKASSTPWREPCPDTSTLSLRQ